MTGFCHYKEITSTMFNFIFTSKEINFPHKLGSNSAELFVIHNLEISDSVVRGPENDLRLFRYSLY